jgi:transposase, IS30 family
MLAATMGSAPPSSGHESLKCGREMRVSHETIYTSIYLQGKGNLRRELHTCLRIGRALRKPQHRPDERRGRIHDMVNISQRPPAVEDRAVPGHWLGDLILCSTASA